MKATRLVAFGMLLTGLALQVRSQQSSTTPQPAPPPLVGSLAGHPAWPSAKNTSDVDTAEHLVASLYDVISGPAGKPRDWDRFRSLFLPDGRLGVIRADAPATVTLSSSLRTCMSNAMTRISKRRVFSSGVSRIVSKSSAISCMFGAPTKVATQRMMQSLSHGVLTRSRSCVRRGATGWRA
jgi:hypothetical protein